MKRRIFFSLSGIACLSGLLPFYHLGAQNADYTPGITDQNQQYISWATDLLKSNLVSINGEHEQLMDDYMKPSGGVKQVSFEKGFSLYYENQCKTNIEIRVEENGQRIIFR